MKTIKLCIALFVIASVFTISGCKNDMFDGYQQGWPYPENVNTVFVEMFDSKSFRRDYEYNLSDAICKELEVQTPYKIIADRKCADTVLSGYISSIGSSVLATERESGSALENEVRVTVVFTWKNLQTGELLVENKSVTGVATYSTFQSQTFDYAAAVAVNKTASKVVEAMQNQW